jgi:translation initiation factor IF-2
MVLESPIIYELENSLKAYAKKILPKDVRRLEVLAVFGDSKGKERVVGGKVILGPIKNQEPFEIWQDKKLIGRGKMKNLQSQRKDIPQAETGMEAGLLVESDEPIKIGQQLLFVDSE